MAEVTGLRNSALPYEVYGAPFGVVFPILDADGDFVTGAASLDSEVSKNGDTFADCTNEATEIGSTGYYYLLLTAAEMTADVVAVQVKTATSGAKTTPLVFHPRKLVTLRSGTAAGGATGSITLDSGASAIDDYYNGCLIVGTLDSNVEARICTDYNGSTKVATVVPDWVTTPDSDDTFVVSLPEGMQITQADLRAWIGVLPLALSSQQVQAIVPNTQKVDVETVKTRAVSAAGAIVVGGFVGQDTAAIGVNASGHVARVTVTDAVTAGVTLAASAVTAIWAALTSALTTVGSIGKLLVDNVNVTIGSRATQTTADAIEADTQDIQSRLPAALGANGNMKADLRDMIGVAQSVTDLKDFADEGYDPSTNKVQGVVLVDTTTTLTDAPSDSAGVVTLLSRLSAIRAGYLDNLSAGAVALASSLTTLAGKFTGITLLAEWLGIIAGKQTGNTTARTELRATGAGSGTYDEITDSQEAIRDRGDAAWSDSGTPPTASAIASQVRTELTPELARVDVAVSTRLAASSYTAPPSAATNASAVRTELATELARMDVAISTRLASLSYTAPLDAAGIRSAIGIAAANLDTQLDALPTNAELAAALAAADDATLAAVAALATAVAALPTATQNADALLKHDMSTVTGEASRSLLNAIRFIRNKWTIAGGVLTVFKEDDSTSAWTGAATQTAGNPVSEIDPA